MSKLEDLANSIVRNHLMVDIETLNTGPDAAIVTIGAVMFDPYGEDTEESLRENGRSFYVAISMEDNEKHGRSISAATIKWWLQQSKEAQEALYSGDIKNLRNAMTEFRKWIVSYTPKATRVWANSPSFDCVILEDAFKALNLYVPWKFWETQDLRTIKSDAYPDGEIPNITAGVAHNALDDAIKQALVVQHCKRKMLTDSVLADSVRLKETA